MLDMIVQPEALEEKGIGMLCARYASSTAGAIVGGTVACKGRGHVPLGAWVEEGQGVSNIEGPVVSDPNLQFAHVEDQAWSTRVVAEYQI